MKYVNTRPDPGNMTLATLLSTLTLYFFITKGNKMSEEFRFHATLHAPSPSTVQVLNNLLPLLNQQEYSKIPELLAQSNIESKKTIEIIKSCFSDYSDYADGFTKGAVALFVNTATDNEVEMEISGNNEELTIQIEGQDHGADDFGASFFGILSALEYAGLKGSIKTIGFISKYLIVNDGVEVEYREREC
jgi:hypothetical protein